MAILTLDDLATYAPGISQSIDEAYLQGLISRAQAYIESDLGVNRPLETTQFTETYEVNIDRIETEFYLRHFPVLTTPEPILRTRTGLQWSPVSASNFVVESDGKVETNVVFGSGNFSIPIDIHFPAIKLQVVYSAGFDFTVDTSDVIKIKAIAGNLTQYMFQMDGGESRLSPDSINDADISSYSAQGDSSITYAATRSQNSTLSLASSGGLNSVISNLLRPLKIYAPRMITAT